MLEPLATWRKKNGCTLSHAAVQFGGGGNRIFGNSPEKLGDAIEDDALSDARRLDARLAALIRAWPRLPEDVKGWIAEVLILTDADWMVDAGRGASNLGK